MGASPKFAITSPIGRIVEGDPWTANSKDKDGNLRVYKSGPNAGQPNPQYYVGLAVPKMVNGQPNPDWASFYQFVVSVANAAWPALFPGKDNNCTRADFAWKIIDGDGVSKTGIKMFEKPGCAGHWIVSFSSSFAPQCVVETSPGVYGEITNQELLKRGYYVRIGASISGNDSLQTPGLYMNLEKIELKGIGEVIQTGISAAQAFGSVVAAAIPEGMQALTPGHTAGAPSGAGPAAGGTMAPAPIPMAVAPAPVPVAAPPATGPVMLPAAKGLPYEQYIQAGWTDEQLVAAQMMAPRVAAPAPSLAPVVVAPAPVPTAALAPAPTAAALAPVTPPSALPVTPSPSSAFMGGVPVMLPAASGVTYEQYQAAGWTDEQLVAAQMMAAR